MNGKRFSRKRWCQRWAALVLALCWAGSAGAQTGPEGAKLNFTPALLPDGKPPAPTSAQPAQGAGGKEIVDPNVVPAGCSTCGNGLFGGHNGRNDCVSGNCGGCSVCGSGGQCVPGRLNCCSDCEGKTPLGKLLCGLYCCICCPDPCYDPCWLPQANAAFFVDSARPVTQMRIRWDAVYGFTLPDRSEFFWGRIGVKGPPNPETNVRYHDLALFMETALTPQASLFVEMPYRSLDPQVNNHAAGFGDINLGTKALIFDCELLQIAFQFRTYILSGNFNKGLGTGHVSLEPSLLFALKLTPDTYLQAQIAEWIPIAGDNDYMGAILHYHFALNQVLCRILPDVPLIGTIEANFYSFQDGAFTDPVLGPFQKSSAETYVSFGPGIRLDVCKKIDFGVSAAISLGDEGPQQFYRTEFRWRF